jgi:hypothetical protein
MSRDTIIRDTAYAIWEAEGRPEGRSHQHWLMAERQVARNTTGAAAKAKPDGAKTTKTASSGAAKRAPAKKAAGKAPVPKTH